MNKRFIWMRLFPMTVLIGTTCLVKAQHMSEEPSHAVFVLDQVQMRQLHHEANGTRAVDYQINVLVGFKGSKPNWWGKPNGEFNGASIEAIASDRGPQLLDARFIDRKGRTTYWGASGTFNNLYDPSHHEYYVNCDTIVNGVSILDSTVVGTIKMGDGSTIPFAVPVGLALQHPPKPTRQAEFLKL